jgi:hypothetical protein
MHCLDPRTDYSSETSAYATDDLAGEINLSEGSLLDGWEMTIIASVTGAIALLAFLV